MLPKLFRPQYGMLNSLSSMFNGLTFSKKCYFFKSGSRTSKKRVK